MLRTVYVVLTEREGADFAALAFAALIFAALACAALTLASFLHGPIAQRERQYCPATANEAVRDWAELLS